jgi:predicted GTPase
MANSFNILQPTINFGIIGCVSSGKSTLLNSLFCDTYSDMKIKRTTMIPQVYQCDPKIQKNKTYAKEIRKQNEEINKKIIEQTENKTALTIENCYEKIYKVTPIENFIKLPSNINVAIFDIPGLNDSQTKNIYFQYLNQNFYKFDYILFVIDIQSALNTSDEMDILKLIKDNISNIKNKYNKDIKLLVVCNKCDNMDWNKETNQLEMDEPELEEMYEQIVKTLQNELKINYDIVKYSAEDTYVYRMLDNEHSLDDKYIDRLGSNELGKIQWKKIKEKSKSDELLKILRDKIDVKERLKCTGYAGLIDKINNSVSSISEILLDKITIIEDIIVKKEKDLTKVNTLFDTIYNYIKEIKLITKDLNIDSAIIDTKKYWHDILSSTFPFTTITPTNHNTIKTNYYEMIIKYQNIYKGVEFNSFISNYISKETEYFVLNLDSIIDTSYSVDTIIDNFNNIYINNGNNLPVDKLINCIYKIPINDIHFVIENLKERFFIDYDETCKIYINYYKRYNYNLYDSIKLLALSNFYMKEYISTNNISYSILSIIVEHYNNNKRIGNFLGDQLETDIEKFLEPFQTFIKYLEKIEDVDLLA